MTPNRALAFATALFVAMNALPIAAALSKGDTAGMSSFRDVMQVAAYAGATEETVAALEAAGTKQAARPSKPLFAEEDRGLRAFRMRDSFRVQPVTARVGQ